MTDPERAETTAPSFVDLEALRIANAKLDEHTNRLAGDLLDLSDSLQRFAALADRWDLAAERLAEYSPNLAAQARQVAQSIRDGVAGVDGYTQPAGEVVGKAGAFSDVVANIVG
jgi:nucleotidyltransferase/DNA polymerase involved in DNA repair